MTNALLKCTKCSDIFRNRHDLNNHVKSDHQSSVKVKFQNGGVTEVKRAEDNMFKCKCGKSFKLANSLRRHGKECNGELTESAEDEEERMLMDVDDFDASESLIADARVIPADCFGELISYEKC
jgi:uncharacterized C2H2 Zn-finger protein